MKWIKQEKGLTLIEMLVSVVLLAIGVLVITALLSNSTKSSGNNMMNDQALQSARTVLEEIKGALDGNEAALTLFGQSLNLAQLRNHTLTNATQTIYFPDAGNRQYQIVVESKNPNKEVDPVGSGNPKQLNSIFREIVVTSTKITDLKTTVTLQALVAYN